MGTQIWSPFLCLGAQTWRPSRHLKTREFNYWLQSLDMRKTLKLSLSPSVASLSQTVDKLKTELENKNISIIAVEGFEKSGDVSFQMEKMKVFMFIK